MGKRTTTRHKEDNTFRFQTFEEKLRQISVNVNLSIRDGRGENPEGKETYFSQEIEKWVDLNRTETFADLLCKVGADSKTLAQLILQKEKLAKILLEHLENGENVASFEPTFALATALSRDLGEEFYPHFQDFFKVIVKIVLESKNTNIIEAGFKCYAYLSKYLRRQIIKDLQFHMKQFSCFLDPKLKTYVIIFACEAFSIVAGKYARDHPEKFLKLIYGIFLRKHPEHAVGVATLLFAIFKGVANTLKLNGPGIQFKNCVSFLHDLDGDEVLVWTDVLSQLTLRLLNHANTIHSESLIHLMEDLIGENMKANRNVTNLLTVYATVIEYKNAGKVADAPSCANLLQSISAEPVACQANADLLTRIVVALIEAKCSSFDTDILNLFQPVVQNLLTVVDCETVETLDRCLRSFRAYFRMFLEPITEAFARNETPDYIKECANISVYCLSEAILQQGGLYQLPSGDGHYFTGSTTPMIYYKGQKRVITMLNASSIKGTTWNCCNLIEALKENIEEHGVPDKISYAVRLLLVFSRLNSKNCESCLQNCINILSTFIRQDTQQSSNVNVLPAIYYILQVFISQTSPQASFYELVPVEELLDHLSTSVDGAVSKKSFCLWSLKILDVLVYFIISANFEKYELLLKEFILRKWDSLANNLQSGFRMIRAITLSILRSTVHVTDNSSDKTIEMLDKFLELEDMSLANNKFSSLGKSVLTECKVIVGSENYHVNLKMMCLKYTLGLMYTNFNLIWTPCVEAINYAGKHVEMGTYWETFGHQFCKNLNFPNDAEEPLRTSILPVVEQDCTEFIDLLMVETFGLPKSEACYSGVEEQLDIAQYKINLWLSLKGQPLSKKEYGDIKGFVDTVIIGHTMETESDEKKIQTKRDNFKLIIPVLQFLEACDLVNVNNELWETALKFLTYPPDVQKAAWKFLFAKRKKKLRNYKEDIDEVINSESMDPVHKFRIDAVDTSINKQYENETAERRSVLMDILLRILIGKERVMKGEKRLQVLRFLAGCTDSDARKYLDLTVGSADELKELPPKIIEIKINKMTSALRVWRYKFPTILDQIVNSVCDLVCSVETSVKPLSRRSLDPAEQIPVGVFEEQKKAALKAGRICVVAFFSSLPRLDMKEETLTRIFDVFIWPALPDITVTSVGSVSWILKLFLVWSTHERYHVLFTKCRDGDVQKSPMKRLFDLLDSKSAVFEVKKYVLGIIFNLINPPDVSDDPEEPPQEHLNCSSNSPLNVSGSYQFTTTERIGVNIVLLGKEVILNLFQDAQTFKKFTSQAGGENCLTLISLLAGFATGGELNEKLCGVIIDTFHMCRNNEETLVNSISAVSKLLLNIENSSSLIMKLAPSFTWITGRRLRTTLVSTLECKQETKLHEIVCGMNAWVDSAADTPNFSKRQESFEKATNLIQEEEFDMQAYTLIFYNCIYNTSHEDDIGMRNSAKNVLLTMASLLPVKASKNESERTGVHKFLDTVVLPKLRGCVHEKDDKRYEDILRILFGFLSTSGEVHGTLKELQKLLTSEIIEGLCDIQVHLRTRAMNKLAKRLEEILNNVSGAVVQAYILPIASHNLFDEDRLAKNFNELIDSSIEVLKQVMLAVSHEQYLSYLNKLLDDPKKNTRLAKQYERVLIAIMDAFHFDLSLACPEQRKGVGSVENSNNNQKSVEQTPKEAADSNQNGDGAKGDEDEDESDKEEFTIPEKPVIAPTLTLIPQTAAVKFLGILKSQIIPKLRKFLHFEERATHKLSRGTKTVDDDVILKIPCTIALVKLLKKIPKADGQNGIRSIIPSITAGLRNGLVSVRNTLRKTLLSVIKELGTDHLRVVIGYLKSSLLRGYQRHVLNYTVAYLLRCLESDLKANPGHVPVKEILSLCDEELYGTMQEEKDVQAIKQKTREASKSNACPILKVCSKCVSSTEQLNSLIDPAIKRITEKKSVKVMKSTRQWLLSVTEGLADNNAVNYYELLDWLLQVIKRDETVMSNGDDDDKDGPNGKDGDQPPNKKRKLLVTPKDHKLIPTLKKKTVLEGKVGSHSLLMEFGLTSLYSGLNRGGKFRDTLGSKESLALLDSFVPILADGIKATSKQVSVVSLRCVTLLMEFDLASFKKPDIIDKLQRNGFTSMSAHCYRNTTDSEITNATFKFLSAFFIRFSDFKVVLQDFELMLKCIQGYLTDGNCSSSALTLLRGILQNKYRCSILPDLMQEVFKQCITSYYQHINEGCREAYMTYLNNYLTNPKDLYVEVQLILRQLDYQHESGRLTAAEILNSLLQSIPEDCFEEVKELIFLKLLATLDKEKQPKVRERLGDAMKSVFRLEKKKSLVRILLKLLMLEKHIPELDTFFLIIGLLIHDPKIFGNDDMTVIIGRIKDVLDPTSLETMCSQSARITQQIKDYMIFQAVVVFKKALARTAFEKELWDCNSPLKEQTGAIFGLLRDNYLLYEHEWVPLIAVDIISIVLNKLQLTEELSKSTVANNLMKGKPVCAFLQSSDDLHQLTSKLWVAMKRSEMEDVLAKGAYTLVLLASVAARLEDKEGFVDIVSSIRKSVNGEVVKNQRVTTVRTVAMGCFRGIAKTSPRDAIEQVVEIMTRVAVRELTDDNVPQELKNEAEKLINVLRDLIGSSEFNVVHARVNDFFYKKRNLNRAMKKEKIMLHPGIVRKRPKNSKPSFQSKKKRKTK